MAVCWALGRVTFMCHLFKLPKTHEASVIAKARQARITNWAEQKTTVLGLESRTAQCSGPPLYPPACLLPELHQISPFPWGCLLPGLGPFLSSSNSIPISHWLIFLKILHSSGEDHFSMFFRGGGVGVHYVAPTGPKLYVYQAGLYFEVLLPASASQIAVSLFLVSDSSVIFFYVGVLCNQGWPLTCYVPKIISISWSSCLFSQVLQLHVWLWEEFTCVHLGSHVYS